MEYQTTLSSNEPVAITIGNFDGVHRGHQRLMQELRNTAQELGATPVLVTFSPHTLLVVRPDVQLQFLTTLDEKLALTDRYGKIEKSIVIPFNRDVADMSATAFLDDLRQRFNLKAMVIGANFSLGHNRKGNIAFLEQYGSEHGIKVVPISLEEAEQSKISSTRIRTLVQEGQVAEANELLGHPLTFQGTVVHGDERGRQLGFPTANLIPDPHKLLPAYGVYAAYVHLQPTPGSDPGPDSPVYKGVVNVGVRPTFNGKTLLVEAYLLDTQLDLYGQVIGLDFIARLRGEERFSGIDALKAQINTDVQQARQILQRGG
ncbi:MAG TPA: bifunctional riboflavin kinase/FAD synthetase [Ktedonobacteraceae bacterium]|nr:bifunctional riboflavin kinase/FAD synthetase [Ktedonobacteraceae bacterium]